MSRTPAEADHGSEKASHVIVAAPLKRADKWMRHIATAGTLALLCFPSLAPRGQADRAKREKASESCAGALEELRLASMVLQRRHDEDAADEEDPVGAVPERQTSSKENLRPINDDDAFHSRLQSVKRTVLVLSGKGGVGNSLRSMVAALHLAAISNRALLICWARPSAHVG